MPQAGRAAAMATKPRSRTTRLTLELHRKSEGKTGLVAAGVERDVDGPLLELLVGPADAQAHGADHERSALGGDAEPLDADGGQIRLALPRRVEQPDAGAGIEPDRLGGLDGVLRAEGIVR